MKQAFSKKLLLLTTTTVALLLAACADKKIPDHMIVNVAPTDESKTGFLVANVTEAQMADVARLYPNMKVRRITKTLFEVFQIDETSLRQNFNSEVRIQKNRYMRLTANPAKSVRNVAQLKRVFKSALMDEVEAQIFLEGCLQDQMTEPIIQVNTDAPTDQFEFSRLALRGEPVHFNARGSQAYDGSAVQTLWIVRPAQYSNSVIEAYLGDEITVTPDTTGEYAVLVVAKDSRNVCSLAGEPLYVTANPEFKPENAVSTSKIENVDLSDFWQINAVNAQESWSKSTGENITVAIIDTGVNYNHPFLAGNIAVNTKEIPGNGIDDDGNGYIDDYIGYDFGANDPYPFDDYGHGSHCAGIAASPIMGIARGAKILPVKVGSGAGMDMGSVIGGILFAVDSGAKVLNLSLGFDNDFYELRLAVEYARQKGVVVVAAAGNGDYNGNSVNNDEIPMYPAVYDADNVITVAATNVSDIMTSYSNYGVRTVHIAAPGGDASAPIISTYKENAAGRLMEIMVGTSMAAPAVVGVAAQALSLKPDLTPSEVRDLLMSTGKASPHLEGKVTSGRIVNSLGVVNTLTSEGAAITLAGP